MFRAVPPTPLHSIIRVPGDWWDAAFGTSQPLPKAVTVLFGDAETGDDFPGLSERGVVSLAEDGGLLLSGLWGASQSSFPGHMITGWSKVEDGNVVRLALAPADVVKDVPVESHGADRKRPASGPIPEPEAKMPAVTPELSRQRGPASQPALSAGDQPAAGGCKEEISLRNVVPPSAPSQAPAASPTAQPSSQGRPLLRGRSGRGRGQGCAKLVRTTTRLYIGVGQVREWMGDVGPRTELTVKVNLDGRIQPGVHQADLLYNKGAHYYWITSRTLKRSAMGKWFLGWTFGAEEGLLLMLRSPTKEEVAAAIAEGFQARDDEEDVGDVIERPIARMVPGRMLQTQGRGSGAAYGEDDGQEQEQNAADYDGQPLPAQRSPNGSGGRAGSRAEVMARGKGQPLGSGREDGARVNDDDDCREDSVPSTDSGRRRGGATSSGGPAGELRDPRLATARVTSSEPGASLQELPGAPGPSRRGGEGLGLRGQEQDRPYPRGQERPPPKLAQDGSAGSVPQGSGGGPVRGGATNAGAPSRQPVTSSAEPPGGSAGASGLSSAPPEGGPDARAALGSGATPPAPRAPGHATGAVMAQPPKLATAGSLPTSVGGPSAAESASPRALQPSTTEGSVLAGSDAADAAATVLRLPSNVSEMLPSEYLPAAVSLRCTVDGELDPVIYACEIHPDGHGACFLYNLPAAVLEGRVQRDWMVSEDGCLVLCLVTRPADELQQQQAAAQGNDSGRSDPATPSLPAASPLPNGHGAANRAALTRQPSSTRTAPEADRLPSEPGSTPDASPVLASNRGNPGRVSGDGWACSEGGAILLAAPHGHPDTMPSCPRGSLSRGLHQEPPLRAVSAPAGHEDAMDVEAVAGAGASARDSGPQMLAQEAEVVQAAVLPPGSTGELVVPRQVLEALHGAVQLPFPMLVQCQVDGELQQPVFLAEVVDAGRELVLQGVPAAILQGRVPTRWGKGRVRSHTVTVVCLQGAATDAAHIGPHRKQGHSLGGPMHLLPHNDEPEPLQQPRMGRGPLFSGAGSGHSAGSGGPLTARPRLLGSTAVGADAASGLQPHFMYSHAQQQQRPLAPGTNGSASITSQIHDTLAGYLKTSGKAPPKHDGSPHPSPSAPLGSLIGRQRDTAAGGPASGSGKPMSTLAAAVAAAIRAGKRGSGPAPMSMDGPDPACSSAGPGGGVGGGQFGLPMVPGTGAHTLPGQRLATGIGAALGASGGHAAPHVLLNGLKADPDGARGRSLDAAGPQLPPAGAAQGRAVPLRLDRHAHAPDGSGGGGGAGGMHLRTGNPGGRSSDGGVPHRASPANSSDSLTMHHHHHHHQQHRAEAASQGHHPLGGAPHVRGAPGGTFGAPHDPREPHEFTRPQPAMGPPPPVSFARGAEPPRGHPGDSAGSRLPHQQQVPLQQGWAHDPGQPPHRTDRLPSQAWSQQGPSGRADGSAAHRSSAGQLLYPRDSPGDARGPRADTHAPIRRGEPNFLPGHLHDFPGGPHSEFGDRAEGRAGHGLLQRQHSTDYAVRYTGSPAPGGMEHVHQQRQDAPGQFGGEMHARPAGSRDSGGSAGGGDSGVERDRPDAESSRALLEALLTRQKAAWEASSKGREGGHGSVQGWRNDGQQQQQDPSRPAGVRNTLSPATGGPGAASTSGSR